MLRETQSSTQASAWPKALTGAHATDAGNAARFVELVGDRFRFVRQAGRWAHFEGRRWNREGDDAAARAARHVALATGDAARDLADDDARRALQKHALRMEASRSLQAMLQLARADLTIDAERFDAEPGLLGVANGVLDLRTDPPQLRAMRAEDYIARLCAAPYDPGARSTLWTRALERAIPDGDARSYLQRAAGATLGGSSSGADAVFLIHGPPRSGKGTVQASLGATLGDYAATAGLTDFARSRTPEVGRPRPELARLQGVRMCSVYESDDAIALDPGLLKTVSGRDPLTVRMLYCAPITFQPQFTLWVASNYRPGLPSDDDGVWERMREIPFPDTIPEAERDPTVRAALSDPEQHGAAILAWAVEGWIAYRERGLDAPAAITRATASYRAEVDPIADFLADRCRPGDGSIPVAELRAAYDDWAREAGELPVGRKLFVRLLEAKGFTRSRSKRARLWRGIELVA